MRKPRLLILLCVLVSLTGRTAYEYRGDGAAPPPPKPS